MRPIIRVTTPFHLAPAAANMAIRPTITRKIPARYIKNPAIKANNAGETINPIPNIMAIIPRIISITPRAVLSLVSPYPNIKSPIPKRARAKPVSQLTAINPASGRAKTIKTKIINNIPVEVFAIPYTSS